MSLTDDMRVRYSRTMALPQVGENGQDLISEMKVLVIGAGGLGSTVLLHLAASGIGTLGIVDFDRVAISNLQRQIIFDTTSLGKQKAVVARQKLLAINPHITAVSYPYQLDEGNAKELLISYDVIVDCCDNFSTRFILSKICFQLKKPLISAAVIGFEGYVAVFKPYEHHLYPCYQCFCPSEPQQKLLPQCSNNGVLGSVVGTIASMQATEVLKETLQIGELLSRHLFIYDGLKAQARRVALIKDPDCLLCATENVS